MAESFAFNVADSLLGKLSSRAYEEISRAYGVLEHLQAINDTLSIVRGVLLDAEQKKNQKHGLREWLRQIQNICSDAEDLFDGFELQDMREKFAKVSGSIRMKVRHLFSSSNPLAFRFKMAHQIKEIRDRLDKVAADGTKFGLVRIDVDPGLVVQRREMTHSHVDASSVIGRNNDRKRIVKLLKEPFPHVNGNKSLCVIPIVGIGGLGKTTLAKLVFNDKRVDKLFQLKIWVCVSDDFDIRQIIIKILNSASDSSSASATTAVLANQENINNLDVEQLQRRLRHTLSGKKFLLVLDDIWNDDRAKWFELADLIKVGAARSKVIVTTRSISIASMMGTIPSYVLKGLSSKNCLSLFLKWAFKEGEEEKYPNLVEIGKEIVKKCQGVPLAVRTLGSSLFLKFDFDKWEFVRDHEIWNIEQKKHDILPALKLSYDEMPSYLWRCFAFFSLYPKDYTFLSDKVSVLWVALGLVHSRNGSPKPENIARQYIDELNSRSFLQDFEDLGYYCKFKVHDLVHDLALYVANEELLAVKSAIQTIPEQVRHLSILENASLGHALFPKSRRVRTVLFPIQRVGLGDKSVLDTWISRCKYLRVLDLSDSSLEILPNSIDKFEHLCVLDLTNNCRIKKLPNSICKLKKLQFLSVKACMALKTLPDGFGKMISLRELYITTEQSVLSDNEFASLNNLRTLGFYRCHNLKFLWSGFPTLPSLETLSVVSCEGLECLPLYIIPKLQTLSVTGCRMLNFSSNNNEGPIQRLKLKHLILEDFRLPVELPNWITYATDTLEMLVIKNFPNLEVLPQCLTTMTRLKKLSFVLCPQLLRLPYDMHCLTTLQDLHIYRCPVLCQKYQPQSGVFWPMISHIKHVSIGKKK